jgi:hypothetical protein
MKFIKRGEHIVLSGMVLAPQEIPVGSQWRAVDSGTLVTVVDNYKDERTQNNFIVFTANISKVELTAFRFQIEYEMIINEKACGAR